MSNQGSLEERLAAAGVEPGADPIDAWSRMREAEGPKATVIDLYSLVARPRGMAPHELPQDERYALARAVMPLVWPGFATTRGSERTGDTITIVEYDPSWPAQYERWRTKIHGALGDRAVRIEHVGSTSVPRLPAKPIIDIQVSVVDLENEAAYVPALEPLGVQMRSRDEWHRYFRPFPGKPRDVHVHVCATGSRWEHDHLRFRDYLRSHDGARLAYAAVKREAARVWSDDGIAYTDAKSELILKLLQEAETSAGRPGT